MVIRPEPLTHEAFQPFGEVIELDGRESEPINQGRTEKFAGLAKLVTMDSASMVLHRYRSQPAELPVTIETMERHPLGCQAFIPLHGRPFPVVVAPAGPAPETRDIRLFLSDGRQGVNLAPGTWHHYQLSLDEVSEYLVIERGGTDPNCDQFRLAEPLLVRL